MNKILITGGAGFIGFHLAKRMAESESTEVIVIDNINDYYDVRLKYERLALLGFDLPYDANNGLIKSSIFTNLSFQKMDICDSSLGELFESNKFDKVIHLAAQAGVRYSLENPISYVKSNVEGFVNILECCYKNRVKHLVYASSSSVYGLTKNIPFSTEEVVNRPVSLYAATKASNELMAYTYSHLYGLPCTGLRFFTVYGPWGRPDMAYYGFSEKILHGEPISVFNNGNLKRDFTYIDDIVEGITGALECIPKPIDTSLSKAAVALYNLGNNNPVHLMEFINLLEECIGRKAELDFKPMQPGDVETTYADISEATKNFGYKPATPLNVGLKRFVSWFNSYYPFEIKK